MPSKLENAQEFLCSSTAACVYQWAVLHNSPVLYWSPHATSLLNRPALRHPHRGGFCKCLQGQAACAWGWHFEFAPFESTVLADKCTFNDASSAKLLMCKPSTKLLKYLRSSVFGWAASKMGITVYHNSCQSAYKKVYFHFQRLRENLQLLLGFSPGPEHIFS